MKITLSFIKEYDKNDKPITEEKTYTMPPPKAILIRKAAELSERLNPNRLTVEDYDKMADFVVEMFGHKFTADELSNGIAAEKFVPTALECINGLLADLSARMGEIPNVEAAEAENR